MINGNRSTVQIKCYGAPGHIFFEPRTELTIEDSIGCDMVSYWHAHKAADEKAKVTVDVLIVIDGKAPKFSAGFNASDFFVSNLEVFCKKIMGPTKRRLCEEIAKLAGENKITNFTVTIDQR